MKNIDKFVNSLNAPIRRMPLAYFEQRNAEEFEDSFIDFFIEFEKGLTLAIEQARARNKPLLVLIGEDHYSYNSAFLEIGILQLLNQKFPSLKLYREAVSKQREVDVMDSVSIYLGEFCDYEKIPSSFMDFRVCTYYEKNEIPDDCKNYLTTNGFNQNPGKNPEYFESEEGMHERNTIMAREMAGSTTDAAGVVGSAHLHGLIEKTNLADVYEIFPVNVDGYSIEHFQSRNKAVSEANLYSHSNSIFQWQLPGIYKKLFQFSDHYLPNIHSRIVYEVYLSYLLKTDFATFKAVAEKNLKLDTERWNGSTLLHTAARQGNYRAIHWLINKGMKVNKRDKLGYTPLHKAILNNQIDAIKALIKQKANVHLAASDGKTAAHLAVLSGNLNTIKFLIAKGCNFDIEDNHGMTALQLAVDNGALEACKLLLDNRTDVEAKNNDGESLLQVAFNNGHLELAEYLISKGANANVINQSGDSLIHSCLDEDYAIDAIRLLAKANADFNRVNERGFTPLHEAISAGASLKIIKLLIEKGAKVSQRVSKAHPELAGEPPLFLALRRGNIQLIKLLIGHGANVNQQNRSGLTALEWVTTSKYSSISKERKQQIISYLINHPDVSNQAYVQKLLKQQPELEKLINTQSQPKAKLKPVQQNAHSWWNRLSNAADRVASQCEQTLLNYCGEVAQECPSYFPKKTPTYWRNVLNTPSSFFNQNNDVCPNVLCPASQLPPPASVSSIGSGQ